MKYLFNDDEPIRYTCKHVDYRMEERHFKETITSIKNLKKVRQNSPLPPTPIARRAKLLPATQKEERVRER